MNKEQFIEKNVSDRKDFVKRFRAVVDMEMLQELYSFFRLEDTVLLNSEGLFVEKRINNAEANLNHMSPELYGMIKFAESKTIESDRMVFLELADVQVEDKKIKKANTHK
jgi:hypothetical protein